SADRLVEDLEALQGQLGIDDVLTQTVRPRSRREAAGDDAGDARGVSADEVGELSPDSRKESRDQRLVAQNRAGLDRRYRVTGDRPNRLPQFNARQLRGAGGERIEPELQPGRDRATEERAVGPDGVD